MSHFLIGPKSECYIVEEVIKVDELDKGNISAALGKQEEWGKAELSCATLGPPLNLYTAAVYINVRNFYFKFW